MYTEVDAETHENTAENRGYGIQFTQRNSGKTECDHDTHDQGGHQQDDLHRTPDKNDQVNKDTGKRDDGGWLKRVFHVGRIIVRYLVLARDPVGPRGLRGKPGPVFT